MAAATKHAGSKKRKHDSSAKVEQKRRFSKKSRPGNAKPFKKGAKARALKANHAKPLTAPVATAGGLDGSKKRKRTASVDKGGEKVRFLPLSKSADVKHANEKAKAKPTQTDKPDTLPKKEPKTPKERRLAAKEMVEARKKKRKPNYSLEKELASLWEKMRCYNVGKEERSKLVTDALHKMSGKYLEIANSHISARVLQTCVKYGSQEERNTIFEELRPHLLTLSRKKYAVHLVKKLLDTASKKQFDAFISSLHGHVGFLIRHSVGSAVVEHAYHLANGSQRQRLLVEMYSTELQLFKDLTFTSTGSLVDIISKLRLQKSLVLQHMTSIIQPLLEKGIVEYSIIHTVLLEYLTIADKTSAVDVIQQLLPLLYLESAMDENPHASSKRKNKRSKMKLPLLVKMMRTRDGLKIAILCVKYGTAKDRKKIIKGIKDHVRNLAFDQCGSLLLSCILSVVDDTKLLTKIVMRELQPMLKELVLDKYGRRLFFALLHPQCHRYFTPDDLACLNFTMPSLCSQDTEGASEPSSANPLECDNNDKVIDNSKNEDSSKIMNLAVDGKKEPFVRRKELLVDSGLAESLIATCVDNAGELLRSNFGREVIFEVAVGGSDAILQTLGDRLADLHKAIAAIAALPKSEESKEDHVFEHFHSSRTIRKLVLDCPAFAESLWNAALQGKSELWARGHSCKVVAAFLESADTKTRDLAKSELQPLVDRGILKILQKKQD